MGSNQILTSTANTAPTKTTTNQIAQSQESTSRIGFKGNEDLGGGTSAFFTAEFQLYPDDQNLSGSSNSGLLNRQTFVGLKQTGLGAASVGRQYTPLYLAYCTLGNSASVCNNVAGDLIYSNAGAAGTSLATTITGNENSLGFTNRASNSLYAKSDAFYGVTASAMYQANNTNTTQTAASTGGTANQSGYGLGLDYAYNKFNAHLARQQFTQQTTGTAFSITSTTQATIVSGIDTQTYAGVDYDFGILKAYVNGVSRTIVSTYNSSQYLSRSAQQIGVRGWMTSTVEGWISSGVGKYHPVGTTSTVNFVGYQLGSNYWLSKRTNLYAIFGSVESSGNQQTMAGPGSSKNQYALGMRHTF
jgi:predicted porin